MTFSSKNRSNALMFRNPLGVPWWIWVIGGGAILYLVFAEPVKKAGKAAGGLAIQAGKVYVTKGALK